MIETHVQPSRARAQRLPAGPLARTSGIRAGIALTLALLWFAARAEEAPTYDRVSISVSEQDEIANDTLIAVLYVQREGTKQSEVADAVNKTMRAALDTARAVDAVNVQTLGYVTSPVYNRETITGWRARQSLRLDSGDSVALTQLVGTLQETLAVESITYAVSPAARRSAETRLIVAAMQAFKQRATLVATQLGRTGYRIVHVDVSAGGFAPPPMPMRAMAMARAAEIAPPAVEAGEQTLSVTISGTIEVSPLQ